MQVWMTIGISLSIIGGCSYAFTSAFKHHFERKLLNYIALLCYQKISCGEEILWDDLEALYKIECERLTNTSGFFLTHPEGHELVMLLNQICDKHPSVNPNWQLLIRNLKRSLPQGWIVAAGQNYIPNFGALMMLFGMFTIRSILRGNETTLSLFASIALVGIPAIIFFLIVIYQTRIFLLAHQAIRKIRRDFAR